MKRWIWLAVLPWAVVMSTGYPHYAAKSNEGGWIVCEKKEPCEDMTEALNEAHERRAHKTDMNDIYINAYNPCEHGICLDGEAKPCKVGSKEITCVEPR